jgi:chemotaxis protein methyltransferase CheR
MGVIHQQQGDIDSALTEFKRTIYIDPDFVLAHFAVANLQRQQGKLDEACRSYENALRALQAKPEGSWTVFLGGFRSDLLAKTCERSLLECSKGT